MEQVPHVKLPSGAKMPVIGAGTYKVPPGDDTYNMVVEALKVGYRHLDLAKLYANEADAGRAVRDSGIPRSDIFITSKIRVENWGYENALKGTRESNDTIGCEYIDLYLLHTPFDSERRAGTWQALEELQAEGILKDIGVSNFGIGHLKKLSETWKVKPAVNQIEFHPWLQRKDLVAYCQDNGILVQAFSPLARSQKLGDPVVSQVATEVGATPAQVLISWCIAKGIVTLPKSTNPARLAENLHGVKIVLTREQVTAIDGLDEKYFSGSDHVSNFPV